MLWKLRYSVKDPKDRERATTIAIVIVGKKRDDIKNKAKKDNNSIRSKRKNHLFESTIGENIIGATNCEMIKVLFIFPILGFYLLIYVKL